MARLRVVRWVGYAVLGLAVLLVLAVLAISTPWFKDWLRGIAVKQAASAIDGEVRIGSLSGSLWHDVTLRDVVILQDGKPTVRVASVTAHYSAIQLARGRFDFSDVELVHPVLSVVQDAAGWNVSRLVRTSDAPKPSEPRAITVRRVRVTDGDVTVAPLAQQAQHVAGIGLEAGVRYTRDETTVHLVHLTGTDTRTALMVRDAAASVTARPTTVLITGLAVETPRSKITGRASYDWSRGPAVVDAALDVPALVVDEFAAYLPPKTATGLVMKGTLSAKGPTDGLHAVWALDTGAGSTTGDVTTRVPGNAAAPVHVEGNIALDRVDLAPLTGRADLASRLTARGQIQADINRNTPARSHVQFALDAPDVTIFGYGATNVHTTGSLEAGVLRAAGSASAYRASATFTAVIRGLDAGGTFPIALSGRVQHLDLRQLPAAAGAPRLATNVSGRYAFSLNGRTWRAEMTADGSTVEGATLGAGTHVLASSNGTRLTASLSGEVRHLSGELLRRPAGEHTTIDGNIQASVVISDLRKPMSIDGLEGTAQVTLAPSIVAGMPIDSANLDASLSNGVATIRQAHVIGNDIAVDAQGTATLGSAASGSSDLTYAVDVADLRKLQAFAPDLEGIAHVDGKLTGPFDQLASTGTFRLQQFKYRDTVDALAFNGTFDATLPDRALDKLDATVKAESTFLTVKGYELRRLALTARYRLNQVDVTAKAEQQSRTIQVEGGLFLQPAAREVRLRQFSFGGPGAPWQLAPGREAVINYSPDGVRVTDLALVRGEERLAVDGLVGLGDAAGASDVTATIDRLNVGDLYTMFAGTPRVTGTAGGSVHLTGALANPSVTADVSVLNGVAGKVPFSDATTKVSLRDRRAAVDARVEQANGLAISVTGTAPTSSTAGPLNLRVHSDQVSLGLVQAFTQHLDKVAGVANVDLAVTGPLTSPELDGSLRIVDGAFLVVPTGVDYQQFNATVQFDKRRAAVQQFSLFDDDGHSATITGTGDLFTDGRARAFDVTLRSDDLHVLRGKLGEVRMTLNAHADGDLSAPHLTGRMVLNRARLEVDELLRQLGSGSTAPVEEAADATAQGTPVLASDATPATVGAAVGAGPAPAVPQAPANEHSTPSADTGMFARATIELEVIMPDDLVLRGRGITTGTSRVGLGDVNMTVGGKLDITKAAGETPIIVGPINVVRGFYQFQGRRFDVTRDSSVTFRGVQPINPALDVTGEREVAGIVAQVRVGGTMRRPTIDLSSKPPLEQGDVLSLIIFNQSVNELGQGEQTDLLQRATDMAASAVAAPLAASLGRALDVDLFEIRTPASGQAGEVNVGRQLNQRLFVGFRQEFGEADASRLSLEYQLTHALRLLTSVAQGADRTKRSQDTETAGVDVVYLIRY